LVLSEGRDKTTLFKWWERDRSGQIRVGHATVDVGAQQLTLLTDFEFAHAEGARDDYEDRSVQFTSDKIRYKYVVTADTLELTPAVAGSGPAMKLARY
jgi:hypothetical protein